MRESSASGQETGVPEFDVFVYPPSPWNDSLAGVSEKLAELFPRSKGSGVSPGVDRSPDATGATHPPAQPWPEAGFRRGVEAVDPPECPREEDWATRQAEEIGNAEERGRSRGMEAGLALGREEAARFLEGERLRLQSQAGALSRSFAEERAAYFHRVEQETVALSLAIAVRILRREAQVDPLLLTGAVRVALGQLAENTSVRLRVPAEDLTLWREAMARMPGLVPRPEVIADDRMELGECRMETEIGSADLGLWPQLKEIERGFFDRIDSRSESSGTRPNSQRSRETSRVADLAIDEPSAASPTSNEMEFAL